MAAVDYFLKLDGIEGDSFVKGHEKEINVDSFSWGLSQSGSVGAGGGGGTGKVQFQDFHFTMATSKASPSLFLKCASGHHFIKGVLSCRKAGGDNTNDFLKFTLTDVLISSYSISGDGSIIAPTDSLSLNFAKVEMSFKEQKPDGTLGAAITTGWDLKQNKAV